MARIAALRRSDAVRRFALVALPGQQPEQISALGPGHEGEAGGDQQPVEHPPEALDRQALVHPPGEAVAQVGGGQQDECGEQQRAVDEAGGGAQGDAPQGGEGDQHRLGGAKGVALGQAGLQVGGIDEAAAAEQPAEHAAADTPGPRGAGRGLAAGRAAAQAPGAVGHHEAAEQGGHQRDGQHPQQRYPDGLADGHAGHEAQQGGAVHLAAQGVAPLQGAGGVEQGQQRHDARHRHGPGEGRGGDEAGAETDQREDGVGHGEHGEDAEQRERAGVEQGVEGEQRRGRHGGDPVLSDTPSVVVGVL